jgi:hypothetical protein
MKAKVPCTYMVVVSLLIVLLAPSWLVVLVHSDCVGSISEVEYDALKALYDSTDGVNWRWLPDGGVASHWHFPATLDEPCGTETWDGLQCNSTMTDEADTLECYISVITLEGHELAGPIPSAIGTLTQLEILHLSRNILTGSLPEEVGGMTSLLFFDVQDNYMSQQLPTELASLGTLNNLYLDSNYFEGTVPSELGNMIHLSGLYLKDNHLQSTIPTELGSMRSLRSLYLDTNHFSGSIPSELCSLAVLRKLYTTYNILSGSLPSCLGEMTQLHMLVIYGNLLSGRLPPQLGNMTDLLQLSGETNFFTGHIPTEIYMLQNVEQFIITLNYLSGTLPSSVSSLTSVYQFEASANLLVGSLPSELFALGRLQFLFMDYNSFSHTIPDAICDCPALEYVYLNYNRLVGTIPNRFHNSSVMKYVDVAANLLTGTIPSTLYKLQFLQLISVTGNYFTGTISSAVSNLSDLELLNVGSCVFTGSFPEGLSMLTSLKGLTAELNFLTGSVIAPLSSSRMILQALEIDANFLSGTLPAGFANLVRLEDFTGSHNMFTGPIDFLFNRTANSGLEKLEYIDLSNNALSGTIPDSMFAAARYRPLSAVVLYQNCFTGSLPAAICQARNLTILILDSVSSAPACDVRFTGLWKDLFKVIIGKRSLQGTIPGCIWSMRSLGTLHLAGNGLGGTLPNALVPVVLPTDNSVDDMSDVNRTLYPLNDVSLGSNAFTGTIPLSWQQWPWKSLDLSDNKLTGVLSDGFVVNNTCSESEIVTGGDDDYYYEYDDGGTISGSSNTSRVCGSVDLTVNRLSGRIPGAFRYAEGVNILDGNLFDCRVESLPVYDPMSSEYICGSSDFNNSLILWACCLLCAVLVLLCLYGTPLLGYVKGLLVRLITNEDDELGTYGELKSLPFSNIGRSISRFLSFLRKIAALSLLLQCFYVFVCMVSYMGMKASNEEYHAEKESTFVENFTLSTHTYQYAWLSTAGYLHGSIPVAAVIIYLFVSVAFVARFLSPLIVERASTTTVSEPPVHFRTGSTSIRRLQQSQAAPTGPEADSPPQNRSSLVEKAVDTCVERNEDPLITTPAVTVSPGWNQLPWSTVLRLSVLVLIHAIIMISVNILYIYVILTGLSSNLLLFMVQFALSVFKLLWNRYYVRFVVAIPAASTSLQPTEVDWTKFTSVAVHCCSFMVLFTFIVSPVLATFFSDNTCFRYFITGQPTVNSAFQSNVYACYLVCHLECQSICHFSTDVVMVTPASVVPSWQYSYQCSSSLLVNYTPVLLYSFAITGLLVPLLQYLYCRLSSDTIERFVSLRWIAGLLANSVYAHKRNPSDRNDEFVRRPRRLVNGVSVVSRAYINVGVLITFGMASPLLAIAVCLDCVNLYAGWKLLILRYISIFVFPGAPAPSRGGISADKADVSHEEQVMALERLNIDVAADIRYGGKEFPISSSREIEDGVLWMVVWTAGLFWGLFVFDMYGDIYGAVDGLCMIMAPTVGGAVTFYLARRCRWLEVHCIRNPTNSGSVDTAFGGSVRSPVFDPQSNSSVFEDIKL